MRILITGDRFWPCPMLAEAVLRRLVAHHGKKIIVVHGDSEGVEQTFALASQQLEINRESYVTPWDDLSHPDSQIRCRFDGTKIDANAGTRRMAEMIALGAEMCLVLHRDLRRSIWTKASARQAISAGIATWLIESNLGNLDRLRANDPRLK